MVLLDLCGCASKQAYLAPEVETPRWRTSEVVALAPTDIPYDWWKGFCSEALNALIEQALEANHDLQAALQRIEQVRAQSKIAGAPLLPDLGIEANAGHKERLAGQAGSPSTWKLGGAVRYELDLFGKNRARFESAQAGVLVQSYAYEALSLVLMAEVAQSYFKLLELRERQAIAQENVKRARDLRDLIQTRFDAGSKTALDLAQQETLLHNSEALLRTLEASAALEQNSLALLLGKAPQDFELASEPLEGLRTPGLAIRTPEALLDQRPDIRAAEAQLQQAHANIEAARAAFYPSLNLNAALFASADPTSGPSKTVLGLGSGLTAPIFQGSQLEGQLELTQAQQAELLERYQQGVLVAFREAEDAFVRLQTAEARLRDLEAAAHQAQKAYGLAHQQYGLSVIDFQRVLTAQQTLLQTRDALAQARFDRLASHVALFKAMGGG